MVLREALHNETVKSCRHLLLFMFCSLVPIVLDGIVGPTRDEVSHFGPALIRARFENE